MSENELLQEINNIFLHLTDQEPTPDEEIEARDQLIELFENVKISNEFPLRISLIEDIISKLNNWDTLDLWFKEVEGLKDEIDKFLRLAGVKKELAKVQVSDEAVITESKLSADVEVPQLDVSEIVFQVTEQFKDEIGGLKSTIEQLKKELEGKEERLQEFTKQKSVQKITPLKDVKLAPPEIKIPSIKRPEKAPHIKVHLEQTAEEIIEESLPIETESEDIEFEESTEVPEITEEFLVEQIKSAKSLEKPKLTPVISEIPSMESKSEIPFKVTQIGAEEKEIDEEVDLTPIPVEKPEIMKFSEDGTQLTPLPTERPDSMQIKEEDKDLMPVPSESSISETSEEQVSMPIPTESEEKPFLTPIIGSKPKISPISIEEIDTETIKSSGTDLFDVLSSVASRASEQTLEPKGEIEPKLVKEKVKKEVKEKEADIFPQAVDLFPKEVEPIPQTIEPTPPPEKVVVETEKAIEELPKDKDTLYQELIALEGRRYSLEKNYKDLSNNYGSGIIDEFEFNSRSEGLKNQLDEISSRITKIRRIIASL